MLDVKGLFSVHSPNLLKCGEPRSGLDPSLRWSTPQLGDERHAYLWSSLTETLFFFDIHCQRSWVTNKWLWKRAREWLHFWMLSLPNFISQLDDEKRYVSFIVEDCLCLGGGLHGIGPYSLPDVKNNPFSQCDPWPQKLTECTYFSYEPWAARKETNHLPFNPYATFTSILSSSVATQNFPWHDATGFSLSGSFHGVNPQRGSTYCFGWVDEELL